VPVLPPPEYDHPYTGKLTIERTSSQSELRQTCPYSPFPFLLGCARRTAEGGCYILMADDEFIAKFGYTTEQVFRHERAHCLGWPAHHPGARQP
jgi:hypothetical protein